MKIKILMCFVILLLCNFAYGQTVTKDSYEKAVNYLNCKAVELSLKTNAESKDPEGKTNEIYIKSYEDYKRDFPCTENILSEKIIEQLENYPATKTLADEIVTIKKSWKATTKPEEAVTFLSDTVFNGKYPKLSEFSTKRKSDSDFATLKEDLRSTLPKIIQAEKATETNTNSGVNNNSNSNTSSNIISNTGSNTNSNIKPPVEEGISLTTVVFFILFLFLLAITVISSYILSNQTISSNHDTQKKLYDYVDRKLKNPGTPVTVSQPKSEKSDEINELRNEIDNLRRAISTTNGQLNDFIIKSKGKTSSTGTTQKHQETTYTSESRREVFYFNAPNEDGSFNVKSIHSSYKNEASIYKFTKISSTEAEFQINDSESSFKLALEYPNVNIDPACVAQNAFNPKASKIVTEQVGKATEEGDKWKVTRKAKIRYEY